MIDGTPVSPNAGVLTTIGPLGVDTTSAVGLDIGGANQAFASLTVGGVSGLYAIDLATGAATFVGNFPPFFNVRGLTLRRPFRPLTMYGVTDGNTLITFHNGSPGTIRASVAITGLQAGETIVGIDQNPKTVGLYAVGSSGRLYALDAVTGTATAIGPGPFPVPLQGNAFGVAVDWQSPFNIAVVSDAQQNLLVGTDGVLNSNGPPLMTTGSIVAAASAVVDLGEARFGRLYGIDSATDRLVILGPAVAWPDQTPEGTVTDVGSLGVDTSSVASLDIFMTPSLSNEAFAALDVGGQSRLYTIDLGTGAATLIGTIGTGAPVQGLAIAHPGLFRLSSPTYYTREGDGTGP